MSEIRQTKVGNAHLGRQMRRDREAKHWTTRQFAPMVGSHIGVISATETGKRAMTERLAIECDRVFEKDWYLAEYDQSKHAIPAGLRSWSEFEDKATILRSWTSGVIDGLLQTPDYARGLLETSIGATAEQIEARLKARMERQKRTVLREDPPTILFVVDEAALYRLVGSPEVMAAQMRHLLAVARLDHVSLQVLPEVGHPASASGFVVADQATYAGHAFHDYTFTDERTVTAALRLFTKLNGECDKISESLAKIERTEQAWESGVNPAIATRTAGSASRQRSAAERSS